MRQGPPSYNAGAVSEGTADLTRRKGDYGFDAPLVPALMGATGVFLAVVGLVIALRGGSLWNATGPWLAAVFFLLSAGLYVYTTRVGKFVVWADLLQHAGLRGDEHLLDMGSGRGAVLLMAAKLLPAGMGGGPGLLGAVGPGPQPPGTAPPDTGGGGGPEPAQPDPRALLGKA